MSTSRAITSSGSASSPTASRTGTRSPSPATIGCSTPRIGATTTFSGSAERVAVSGRVSKPTQHGDPLADGVRAGREPLVRQGLPAGERGDRGRRQERAQRRGQVFGLPRGRGHREHEPAGAARGPGRQGGGDQRAQRRGRDEVALARPGVPG